MKNFMLLFLLMLVVGCAGGGDAPSSWRLYRLCVDRAGEEVCVEVESSSQPTWQQSGWADSKADPPVPSWIFVYDQGDGQSFFKTLGGLNPRVKDLGLTFPPQHLQQATATPKRSQFFYNCLHFYSNLIIIKNMPRREILTGFSFRKAKT